MNFDPLEHLPLDPPHLLTPGSDWTVHLPFLGLISRLQEPALFVEIGTRTGDAYCAMAGGVLGANITAAGFAVNRFTQDGDASKMDPEAAAFKDAHDANFGSFSTIIDQSPPDVLTHFEDSTVDLLVIDGSSTGDGFEGTVELWVPKVSPRGLIVINNIEDRREGSSAWSVWSRLRTLGRSLELPQGTGLGFVAIGSLTPKLDSLFAAYENRPDALRQLFFLAGNRLELATQLSESRSVVEQRSLATEELVAERVAEEAKGWASERARLVQEADALAAQVERLEQELQSQRASSQSAVQELEDLKASAGWRVLDTYRRTIHRVLPEGTKRAKSYRKLARSARNVLAKSSTSHASQSAWKPPVFHDKIGPIAMPSAREPVASIIIPAFNNAIYTYNCLRSIAEAATSTPFEVIVADDGSTDETIEMLSSSSGIKLVTNDENLGFTRSCNAAVEHASGRYIVLLNNDTVVLDGWLDALVELAERDASVGLVGAKLVYPDGTLQEAGGVIWNAGDGWNVGRDGDPGSWRYNYVREVDYCSGACILVARDAWERAGGFDERFAPAYYEDTDLAFTLRSLGYRVVYQPKCEVVHYEGKSHGTDISSGGKSNQQINKTKFVEKWSEVLASSHHHSSVGSAGMDPKGTRRFLIIDHYVPLWDQDSGSLRMFELIRLIQELGFKVILLPDDLRAREPYTGLLQQAGVEIIYSPVDVDQVLKEYAPSCEVSWVSRANVARNYLHKLKTVAPSTLVVYDTVDLHFLREGRQAQVEGDEAGIRNAELLRDLELSLARTADVTVVVSGYEAELLHQLAPDVEVAVIPNVHAPHESSKPFSQRRDLLFVGSFVHVPNKDSVQYLVSEILPLVKAQLPDVRLSIVGSSPSREVTALASNDVIVTGWVPDLTEHLDSHRVFVAPLRYGAGLKGKIGQAMAAGLPVVTTTTGTEGMDVADGREILVADDPAEFARKVVDAYNNEDLWQQLSTQGAKYIEANFSRQAVADKLRALVARVR